MPVDRCPRRGLIHAGMGPMTLFTRDLLAQGLQEHEIRGQVRRGTLIRVRHGVYVRADDADTAESRHLRVAGSTWAGLRAPGSCLSHHTAGVVHGLPVPGQLLGPVHVTRPGRGGSSGKYLRPADRGRTVQQVVLSEKRREEALRRLGWWVVRWGWSDLDDRAAFEKLISDGLAFAARTRRDRA